MNVIQADFSERFRAAVAHNIKHFGVKRTMEWLLAEGCPESFAKAICRSIMRKEGW